MDSVENSSSVNPHQCPLTANTTSPSVVHIPYLLSDSLTALLAIAGNLFICTVILRNRKLRSTVTNYFLLSLAVADFLVGAVVIPCAQFTDIGLPQSRPQLCVLMLCLLLMFTQASIFGLLAIAVERYISILKPFQYQSLLSPRNSLLVIAASWLLSILTSLVPLMGWHDPLPPSRECLFNSIITNAYMVYFNFMMCMLVPLVVMLMLYGRIFSEIRRQIRKVAEGEVNISAQRRRQIIAHKEMRTATSLFIILFFFILCWLPLHILNSVMLLCPTCCIPSQLTLATIILSHANSAINPVVYVFRVRSFRDALGSTLLCICGSGPLPASGTTPANILEVPPLHNTFLPGK